MLVDYRLYYAPKALRIAFAWKFESASSPHASQSSIAARSGDHRGMPGLMYKRRI